MTHVVLMIFLICPIATAGNENPMCEEGTIITRSCAYAEQWLRRGLHVGQELTILRCTEN